MARGFQPLQNPFGQLTPLLAQLQRQNILGPRQAAADVAGGLEQGLARLQESMERQKTRDFRGEQTDQLLGFRRGQDALQRDSTAEQNQIAEQGRENRFDVLQSNRKNDILLETRRREAEFNRRNTGTELERDLSRRRVAVSEAENLRKVRKDKDTNAAKQAKLKVRAKRNATLDRLVQSKIRATTASTRLNAQKRIDGEKKRISTRLQSVQSQIAGLNKSLLSNSFSQDRGRIYDLIERFNEEEINLRSDLDMLGADPSTEPNTPEEDASIEAFLRSEGRAFSPEKVANLIRQGGQPKALAWLEANGVEGIRRILSE